MDETSFSGEEFTQAEAQLMPFDEVLAHLDSCHGMLRNDLSAFFPYLGQDRINVLALWGAGTWVQESFSKYPLLHITGVSGCGKSLMGKIYARNCSFDRYQNPTVSVLYRQLKKKCVIDELEKITDDMLSTLNAAHERGLDVPRLKRGGDEFEVTKFQPYGSYILSGIKSYFPQSLESRCLKVRLLPEPSDSDPSALDELEPFFLSPLERNSRVLLDAARLHYKAVRLKNKLGRFNDLYRGILATARLLDQNTDALIDYLKDVAEAWGMEESYDETTECILRYLAEVLPHGQGWYSPSTLADKLEKSPYPKLVVKSLEALGFETKRRVGRGYEILIDRAKLDIHLKRLGH